MGVPDKKKKRVPPSTWRRPLERSEVIALAALGVAIIAIPFFADFLKEQWISVTTLTLAQRCEAESRNWNVVAAVDAGKIYKDYGEALALGDGSEKGKWRDAQASLSKLQHWYLPGVRENLGEANLELGNLPEARKNLESEFLLLDCLGLKSDKDLVGMSLVNPKSVKDVTVQDVHVVLRRARAIAEYFMTDLYAREGKTAEAFHSLSRAIANGYPDNGDELSVLERDPFLDSLRNLPDYETMLAPLRRRLSP